MKKELGLIVLDNCKELGEKVNKHLKKMRNETNDYIVPIEVVRFTNGEGKIKIKETVRNKDVYIISDVGNHSCTYEMFGYTNHYGPDEHFQDIKRVISAIMKHANSITVVMPLLYASRQHRRKGRESLDCAIALQELDRLGVNSVITFDAHDPNIQNAIPIGSFENFYPTLTILKEFCCQEKIDFDNVLVISPDTGAMDRARYYADALSCDVGLFYKRRDLAKIVDGKNPIVAHEYLGKDVAGKDVIVVDDMIASGDSILDVARELKKRNAKKIYIISSFAFFSNGVERINKAHEEGIFDKIYSTNLTYVPEEAKKSPWFKEVDCSKYLAKIIHALNSQQSISSLIDAKEKMSEFMEKIG